MSGSRLDERWGVFAYASYREKHESSESLPARLSSSLPLIGPISGMVTSEGLALDRDLGKVKLTSHGSGRPVAS